MKSQKIIICLFFTILFTPKIDAKIVLRKSPQNQKEYRLRMLQYQQYQMQYNHQINKSFNQNQNNPFYKQQSTNFDEYRPFNEEYRPFNEEKTIIKFAPFPPGAGGPPHEGMIGGIILPLTLCSAIYIVNLKIKSRNKNNQS